VQRGDCTVPHSTLHRGVALHALLRLAATTDARRSQLLGLRAADIDLHDGTIRFTRSVTRKHQSPAGRPTLGCQGLNPHYRVQIRKSALDATTRRVWPSELKPAARSSTTAESEIWTHPADQCSIMTSARGGWSITRSVGQSGATTAHDQPSLVIADNPPPQRPATCTCSFSTGPIPQADSPSLLSQALTSSSRSRPFQPCRHICTQGGQGFGSRWGHADKSLQPQRLLLVCPSHGSVLHTRDKPIARKCQVTRSESLLDAETENATI